MWCVCVRVRVRVCVCERMCTTSFVSTDDTDVVFPLLLSSNISCRTESVASRETGMERGRERGREGETEADL